MKYVCLRYGIPERRRSSAATLRFDQGNATITDGPACEINENLNRVVVLEADDLNHVIALLSRQPYGTVEIRAISEDDA
jgi:hypothetical protein